VNTPTTQTQNTNGSAPAAQAEPAKRNAALLESILSETERYRLALEPTTQDEGWDVAEAAYNAKLVPSADDGFARILIGRPLGIPAMASIQGIALIDQKSTGLKVPCMYAKLKLAILQSHKDAIEYIRPKKGGLTNTSATWLGKRVGEEEVEYTFTIEDARIAGLVGRGSSQQQRGDGQQVSMNNYDRHPGPMLQWRACGRLCDIIGAKELNGITTREDLEDENAQLRAELAELADAAARGELRQTLDAPPQAKPARDFGAEAAALRKALTEAIASKSNKAMKAFREAYDKFKTDAPSELSEEIQRFYSAEVGKARKAERPDSASAAAPPVPAAVGAAPAPQAPASQPAAPPAKKPESPYLPPDQRGDSYDGPEEPFS
jgi:hypothetical protein